LENKRGGVKTRQQMADEYGVCRKTFNKLLSKKHIKLGRGLILPKDQFIIYDKLGIPINLQNIVNFPKISS
jgi:hypothetical protein